MAKQQQEVSLGCRGGDPGTDRARVPALATPEEEWCTESAG